MPISFNQIPVNLRVPGQYIEFDSSRAVQGLPQIPHRILIMGGRTNNGSTPQLTLVPIASVQVAEESFGRNSMLYRMIKGLKDINPYTELWAISFNDSFTGTTATGSITIGGTITQDGLLNVYVAGHRLRVSVKAGDTPASVASAIVTALNTADAPAFGAVNGSVAEQVDITSRHKGENGNGIDLRLNYYPEDRLPTGMTVTITAMSGGAGAPDISAALALIGSEQFHTIICPYSDTANLDALEAEMATRWDPMHMIEGQAFTAAAGTHAQLVALGDSRNSQFLTIMGTGNSPTLPEIWAAKIAAIDAFEPDPARPRQTLPVKGVLAPAETDRFTIEERNLLLNDGISTFTVDAGGQVLIERLITTYQETGSGSPDTAYLDITTMRTLAYLRYTVRARIATKFPRYKLANDGTQFGPGQAIVTPNIIRAELVALFRQWEEVGLAENIDQFKADLLVERDPTDQNRINAIIPPDIINQFRVFAGQVQFRV